MGINESLDGFIDRYLLSLNNNSFDFLVLDTTVVENYLNTFYSVLVYRCHLSHNQNIWVPSNKVNNCNSKALSYFIIGKILITV